MKLFISHQSALEHWRRQRKLPESSANRRSRDVLSIRPPEIDPLALSGFSNPIHIILRNPSARRNSSLACEHIFMGETPIGCFMNIGNGLSVSSPEFCFLQMASQLTLVKLIELGYELCGVYSLPLAGEEDIPERGFYNRQPLTSTKKLEAFLSVMPGTKGHQKAEYALHYLRDGSASPMETKLTMFMTLPYKLGGYRFVLPELNKRVTLPSAIKRYFNKDYYVCDLYWSNEKIAVEYDSDQFHTGADRIANDSNKRNALASVGIQVVTVTKQQLYHSKELESVARTIAKHMGRRLRFKRDSFFTTHQELRKELL